ncbi:hypothetical protein CEQ90_20150 [Lewinellaceae bacterium SD302]|nr:hypothetical protein CEQ90_20150 [Lewinellaceae bacterium SD302]
MNQETIKRVVDQYYNELNTEIDKANSLLSIKRIYDSGQAVEIGFKKFLKKVLPSWVGITRGVIFDKDGIDQSQEIDIILFDNRHFSGLVIQNSDIDSISLISIDTVIGVISVKKTLDKKAFVDAVENIKSVYDLKRSDIINTLPNNLKLTGSLTIGEGINYNKIFSCIVAATDKVCGEKIIDENNPNEKGIVKFESLLKNEIIKGYPVDLVYTIDGLFSYMSKYNSLKDTWYPCFDFDKIGLTKDFLKKMDDKYITFHGDSVVSFSLDKVNPQKYLAQFIMSVSQYAAQLYKVTPNMYAVFGHLFKEDTLILIKSP